MSTANPVVDLRVSECPVCHTKALVHSKDITKHRKCNCGESYDPQDSIVVSTLEEEGELYRSISVLIVKKRNWFRDVRLRFRLNAHAARYTHFTQDLLVVLID